MSIINEALKKTQAGLEERKVSLPPEKKEFLGQIREARESKNNVGLWIISIILLAGLIACGIFLASIMASNSSNQKTAVQKSTEAVAKPQVQPAQISSPLQATPSTISPAPETSFPASANPASALVLNGIMVMGSDQIALINNQIYKTGDYVQGKKILKIDNNSVELLDNGDRVTLVPK